MQQAAPVGRVDLDQAAREHGLTLYRPIVHLTAPLTIKWHFCRAKERGLRELIRSNDPVRLSWLQALLADADIPCVVYDMHAAVLEGSASAIMRRIAVDDDDWLRARRLLVDAGEQVPRAGGPGESSDG